MPTCDLCGDEAPVLHDDAARAWGLCDGCAALNLPREPRPTRRAGEPLPADWELMSTQALRRWARRLVGEDDGEDGCG